MEPPGPGRAPALEWIVRLSVEVGEPIDLGETAHGRRRLVPITGGTAEGPAFTGTVLPGGADIQLVLPTGVVELVARYAVALANGHSVLVENRGTRHGPAQAMRRLAEGEFVDPTEMYFRTTPRFETSDPNLGWLENDVFVATAERRPDLVIVDVFRVT
jgi:hypothetical protein